MEEWRKERDGGKASTGTCGDDGSYGRAGDNGVVVVVGQWDVGVLQRQWRLGELQELRVNGLYVNPTSGKIVSNK